MSRWTLLCLSLHPVPLVLLLGTTKKSLTPSSLHPPFRYLSALTRMPLSLLHAEQSQLFHPFLIEEMLQSINHLCE